MGIMQNFMAFIRTEQRTQHAAMEYRASSAGGRITPWLANKPQWLPRTIDSYDQEAFRKVGIIFTCVEYIANAAGSAPLRVYVSDAEGNEEADPDHPFRDLMAMPNDRMGEARFIAFVTMVMVVTGFVVIEKERDRTGRVIRLWPLRSDWIRPIPRQQAAPDWEYRVPGYQEATILKSRDVIAIPFADTPDESPIGIGPIAVILREAAIMNAMTDFLKVFMDRGAMPLYVMLPSDDPRAAAQWDKPGTRDAFLSAFRQRYGGLQQAVDPLPLVGIKDIKPLGFNFNELAYPELNALADARICQAFGIPPILVGAQVGLERSTFSNTAEARRSFYEDRMTYIWGRIDDAFSRHLLPEFETRPGYEIRFDTSDLPAFQQDETPRWNRAIAAFSAGLISRHPAQDEIGMQRHGADEFLVSFSVTPVPATAPDDNRSSASITWSLAPGVHALPNGNGSHYDPVAPRFVTREGRQYVNEARLSPAEREQRAAIVANNNAAIEKLATLIEPQLQAFFDNQKDRVLAGYNLRAMAMAGGSEQRAFTQADWEREDDLLRRIFASWWDSVATTAQASAEQLLNVDLVWSVSNPFIANLQGVLGERIKGINQTTQTAIEDTLRGLMQEGTTVPDMASAIESLFEQTYKNRHVVVSRTESMVGFAHASTEAYAASGVVNRVQIHDNPNHTESYPGAADGLTCARRNNLVVPLDRGLFHVRSDHPQGSASLSPILTTPLGTV